MKPASRDKLNIASKLTPRKAFNLMRLRTSFYWSRLTKKPSVWGMPFSISIEPTTACNLGCTECPSGLKAFSRPTGNLQTGLNKEIIDQLKKKLVYINYYFQGEPYINPSFLDMVKYASDNGIYTSTSTNAHFLSEENCRRTIESGLDRLIISIDGTTQETYQSYRRRGSLEKVIEGTRTFMKVRNEMGAKKPFVIFQFLVVKPNEHQIDEVNALGRELGVDEVRFKTAQFYDYENGNPLMPDNLDYSRYKRTKDGSYRLKNKLYNKCWRMWQGCVITWDGKVVPCCFDKDAHHQLGTVEETAFRNIWNCKPYKDFRKNILSGRDQIEICRNCTEGTKVWT